MSIPAQPGNKSPDGVFPYEPIIASVSVETHGQGLEKRARDLPLFLDATRRAAGEKVQSEDRLFGRPFGLRREERLVPAVETATPDAARFSFLRSTCRRWREIAATRWRAGARRWVALPAFAALAVVLSLFSSQDWPRARPLPKVMIAHPAKAIDFAAGLRIHLLPDGIAFRAPSQAKPPAVSKPIADVPKPKADIISVPVINVPGVTIDVAAAELPPPASPGVLAGPADAFANFPITEVEVVAPEETVVVKPSRPLPPPKFQRYRWWKNTVRKSLVSQKPPLAASVVDVSAAKPSSAPSIFPLPSFLSPQPVKPKAPSPSPPSLLKDYHPSESMGDVFRDRYGEPPSQ